MRHFPQDLQQVPPQVRGAAGGDEGRGAAGFRYQVHRKGIGGRMRWSGWPRPPPRRCSYLLHTSASSLPLPYLPPGSGARAVFERAADGAACIPPRVHIFPTLIPAPTPAGSGARAVCERAAAGASCISQHIPPIFTHCPHLRPSPLPPPAGSSPPVHTLSILMLSLPPPPLPYPCRFRSASRL